jgi:hypothetical protein
MQKIINGILYDSLQAELIKHVDAKIGTRELYRTKKNTYFAIEVGGVIEAGGVLYPMTEAEALEFCQIHKSAFMPDEFEKLMRTHFAHLQPGKKTGLPYSATKVATSEDKTLYHSPGGFYLKVDEDVTKVTNHEALGFIEDIQDKIDLKKVLRLYFPTIKRG